MNVPDTSGTRIIEVATGEVKSARAPARIQCLALGSCVAAIIYDPKKKIGGIAHVMLPAAPTRDSGNTDMLKHADGAVRELSRQLEALGAGSKEVIARLAGGALVVPDTSDIGTENIEAVREALREQGIKIVDEHVGGTVGRSVMFDLSDGKLQINGTVIPLPASSAGGRAGQGAHGAGNQPEYVRDLERQVAERTRELAQRVQELENVRKATFNLLEDLEREREELVNSKAKDEEMLASIADGLVVADKDMRIILINRAAEFMTGWKSHEVLNRTWSDVIAAATEDGTAVLPQDEPLCKAVHGRATITPATYRYTRKDATTFPAAVTASPVRVGNELIGAILVFRDVTREREIDKAKTEFVSLASHQLRTPLTAIKWYVNVLLAGDAGALNERQKKYMDQIYSGNQRIIKLVNMLLNVSRIELGTFMVEPQLTDVAALAQSVVEEQKPQIDEKHLAFSFSSVKDIPSVPADPQLLRMVMQNVLSNAVKYTPEGGSVTVSLAVDAARNVVITITDTGCGIPKRQQGSIFTKLFRADNVREKDFDGTGLGLYIAKSIIDVSGGRIWFESEEDRGTTFYVTLPLAGMKKRDGEKTLG